jgi:hypothetical protein
VKNFARMTIALVSLVSLAGPVSAAPRLPPDPIPEPDPSPLPRPRPRPPGGCVTALDEGKSYNFASGSLADGRFSVGFGGGFRAVADCNRLGGEANLNVTTKVGPLTVKPFEARIGANTYKTGRNALELSFLTFGYTIDTVPLAETTSPISYIESHDLVVPVNTGGQWGESINVPGVGGTASITLAWETVAIGGAWFIVRVNPDKVEARILASGDAHANLSVTGRYRKGDSVDVEIDATANLYLFYFLTGGRAVLEPKNGTWTGEAAHSTSWRDVLGGSLVLDLFVTDYTVFSLTPKQGFADGEIVKAFVKPF